MADSKEGCLAVSGIGVGVIFIVGVAAMLMVGCPNYEVYRQGKIGEAKLREAESSRQILVQEANAKMEAAKLLAQAEVERAKGVAEANKIIGDGLTGRSDYLMYLWIHALAEQDNNQIIYVPTEAGLPVLEASRFHTPAAIKVK